MSLFDDKYTPHADVYRLFHCSLQTLKLCAKKLAENRPNMLETGLTGSGEGAPSIMSLSVSIFKKNLSAFCCQSETSSWDLPSHNVEQSVVLTHTLDQENQNASLFSSHSLDIFLKYLGSVISGSRRLRLCRFTVLEVTVGSLAWKESDWPSLNFLMTFHVSSKRLLHRVSQ